jgi:Tfp pilus assembly protein PilF/DNA-binding CsgD family transcriptional regulator
MKANYYLLFLTLLTISSQVAHGQTAQSKVSKEIDSLIKKATNKNHLDIKKSFSMLNQALELAEKTNNYEKEITVINEISRFSLTYRHDLQEAKRYVDRIKKIIQKTNNNPKYLAEYHNALGVIYFNNRTDREKACKELRAAISILEKNNLKLNKNHLNNYGIALWTEKRYPESLKYLKLSLANYLSENPEDIHNEFATMITMNIGICFSYLKQSDSSEFYLKKCLDFALDKGTPASSYKSYTYLAVFYQESGRNELAVATFLKARGKENEFPGEHHTKAELYDGLANALSEMGNYKDAYINREIQHKYEDTIKSFDMNKQLLTIEYNIEFDSLLKGQELLELNSKISQAQLTKKYYLMLLLATLFFSGFGFLLFRIRKTKQLNQINLEKESLEKERVKQEAEIELLKSQETITSKNIQLSIRDQELDKLKTSLQHHLDKSTDPEFDDLKKFLRLAKASEKRNDQLKFLDELVKNTNNVFYKKLKEKHSNLTQSELKLSLLINLNLSSNDLIEVFNISLSSLNTKRYRLRRKLNLSSTDILEDYLMRF